MVSINPIRLIVVFLLIAFNLQVALSAEDDDCDAYNSPSKIYMIPMTELIKLTIPELENATAIVRQRYLEIKGEYDAGASELLFVLEAEANLKQMQQALDSKRKNSNSPVKLPETAQAICYSVPLYQQPNAAFNRFNLNELENIQRLLELESTEFVKSSISA